MFKAVDVVAVTHADSMLLISLQSSMLLQLMLLMLLLGCKFQKMLMLLLFLPKALCKQNKNPARQLIFFG